MKILIVGATSNIGYLLSKKLSSRNHEVYIGVHKTNEINSLKEKINLDGVNIKVVKLDVTRNDDRKIIYRIKPTCLVVHDAVGYGGSILEMDMNTVRENYEVNVFSNFLLIKDFYNLWKNTDTRAKIFVTSSISGYLPLPLSSSYSSSKAAVSNICKSMRYELKYLSNNISITLIEPGIYHTGFNQVLSDSKEKYLFRLVEKDNYNDLVNKIVKEIEKDKSKFRIRRPIIQKIFLKIYLILFG